MKGITVNKSVEEGVVLRSICVYIRPIWNIVKVNKASLDQKVSIETIQM